MGRFHPVYLGRSDGMLETATKHGARITKEPNKPTPKQLDDKPKADGVKDYYREVAIDESKHMDWRRKLAAMLARDIGLDQEKGYILAHFPENYRLFEHVKTAKKGEGEPKTKTHAGGGNERQDAYLYGHPLGRKKRFRSPGDFYPHLLWLATDTEGDSDNCTCKICCPEELDASVKERDPNTQPALARRPSTQTSQSRPSNTPTPAPSTSAPVTLPARLAASAQQPASPAPAAQSAARTPAKPMDYDIDRQYGIFLFRQGEMVWFDRMGAWGLGVITERWKVGNNSNYRVQPLSYPDHYTQSVVITKDVDLRPWLAWTVPPYTHERLNTISHALHYNTFDFESMAQGKFGQGTTEIDASIMAAKAIDAAYTPFGPESRQDLPSYTEIRWSGMYLGAEKIWLNEPVRLVAPPGQAATRVLVVRAIVERSHKATPQTPQPYSSVSIIGDVFVMLPHEPTTMSQAPNGIVAGSDTANVPSRMLEDIRRRNIFTIQARGSAHVWRLTERNKVVDMKDIRGRWYESTLFLPILLPGQAAEYDQKAREGVIKEVLGMMNGHGDCNTKDGTRLIPDTRAPKREQAFGKAVPQRTVIVEGVKQPQQQQMPPQQQQPSRMVTNNGAVGSGYQSHGGHQSHASVAAASNTASASAPPQQMSENPSTGFEEFMDLDGLGGGDIMGGFDQSYV
ncbi:hypothetical protein D6C89_06673 [Aureobasidium pullulans]|nr:hypothetical protein D6D26_02970 [Aureobasidium pullulans]THY96230.1 hypothetical protein D6C93_04808 [Aureobasidium pullulans]THZ21395.1 hypothetical protein D6C89_06673 [Aureobasidium pullulans]